jgi:hypothetical protein
MQAQIELNSTPFNIDLIALYREEEVAKMQPITSLAIFDQTKTNFDPNGLFSTAIFGKVGTQYRTRVFSYIDMKVKVLHPLIFKSITDLKSLYQEIMAGKTFAVFDKETKDFVKSDPIEGSTGYKFFLDHLEELKFEENNSVTRTFKIRLVYDAIKEKKHLMRYCLVLPAGLRDYVLGDDGRPQEDDVNKLYRKILNNANLIFGDFQSNIETLDNIRYSLQTNLLEIYEYYKTLLEGKNKLVLGKWAARKTFNSTRNVATSNIEQAKTINDPTRLKYNETYVGLHQFLRNIAPLSFYLIKNKYLSRVFEEGSSVAHLTNVKTLKREDVSIDLIQKEYNTWTSMDGLDKVVEMYSNLYIRHDPVYLNDEKHCIGLIYQDDEKFMFLQDIDELPEGFDKKNVSPITLTELLYMSVYEKDGEIPAFITRYPVANFGSIYPSYLRLKTTTKSKILKEYRTDGLEIKKEAYSFPIRGQTFFNTTSVHPSHNARLTLDFDGDTISVQAVVTDEAIEEVKEYLESPDYYFDTNGKLNFSIANTTLDSTLLYMTTP